MKFVRLLCPVCCKEDLRRRKPDPYDDYTYWESSCGTVISVPKRLGED